MAQKYGLSGAVYAGNNVPVIPVYFRVHVIIKKIFQRPALLEKEMM